MDLTSVIAKDVKTAWTSYSPLATLVPGGILYGLDKAGTQYPYASLGIRLGASQFTTGSIYAQDYLVTINVWASQQMLNAMTIQTAMYQAVNSSFQLPSLPAGTRLIQMTLDTGTITEDPERQLGDFVMIAQTRFILTIQETRP